MAGNVWTQMARRPARLWLSALVVTMVVATGAGAPVARALSSPTPWDGTNPFPCTVQDAGRGTAVPDPGADPYCVRFDKPVRA